MTATFSNEVLRDAFGRHPAGVVFVGAIVDGEACGFAASSFVPVSLDPPLVSFCVQNTSTTWPRLAPSESLGISVLSEEQKDAIRSLSAKTGDRFVDVTVTTSANNAVFVDSCGLWLEGVIEQTVKAGDHVIVVVRLTDITIHSEQTSPVIFYRSVCRVLAPEIDSDR
ncbi:flavin reductase family protein [Nocardia gamkensis]|uniref:flavin reductase family protein n=1 Tax=Nocardia gamkensis TaxID=352869 RepID=UPI0036EB9582